VATIREARKTADGKKRYRIDLRPLGEIYSDRGKPFKTKAAAKAVLDHVEKEVRRGKTVAEMIAYYMPSERKPLLCSTKLDEWIKAQRLRCDAGDISPGYLRFLEIYTRAGATKPKPKAAGLIRQFWGERSILDISTATVDDFALHLARIESLSAKARSNVLAAFRTFVHWLHRRDEIKVVPPFPVVPVDEVEPVLVDAATQDAILAAIPQAKRGIWFAMARLGLRPSEARALLATDVDLGAGWLTVARAHKGKRSEDPVRGTKTRRVRRVPLDPDLRAWVAKHVTKEARLAGRLCFENPDAETDDKRWLPGAMARTWAKACKAVGVSVPVYSGTKHSMGTDALARGVSDRTLQKLFGHADIRSTHRYARLQDAALVHALRLNPSNRDSQQS
jgi:integrase